ncbi:sigma-54 dependent transcriptional regulator [Chloracidobacterium aggregatum]|uniref:Sigma-54-dependent Fis family transcriptional regulator n=1 Tax=Chloracidobacterium sp. N TaxID=2821540 RepID=A0ABX8B1M0_9BACT|nr:sigma-54 dependent transcriptional regulator [Chloracidobacterium aggregatum]QUV84232.1 sigma-54-dependent Fis family transcriptional regulator [Chloracidobacterium sp. 2]QUV87281.1 sigma-54-dependent Fis family transcriptional regulator [Chloracidobacterium sp. S]QUV90186.1 sigma-54-dependent Fis family transcriptional regulator [Chloracidobacterium sp. A]QUV93396.1 sigma-54-dependent Fis family transcriptional regulator [Chloracidobacterium sp. N]QUV96553.1 sigma-54-dependent Fis family t
MATGPADILIVEDKDALRQMWRLTLERAGYGVVEAADLKQARQALRRQPPTVVLTDLRLPDGTGLEVLRAAKSLDPDVPVVVLTAYGSIEEAVAAMKDGAEDFLQKPVDPDHLLLVLERLVETHRLRRACLLMREEYARRYGFPRIIGDSPAMQQVGQHLQRVAPTETTVLLLGESGTGKELFARAMHHLSHRRQAPFVAINCAAIPETLVENELFGHEKGAFTGADGRQVGKFELARGGTLFLDEIGELPLAVQSKFLRALESRTITRIGGGQEIGVDVRIVAATNRDLTAAVAARTFREDLYYRLAVFTLEIPPLRERREDIPALANHFAEKYGREIRRRRVTLSPAALKALQDYDFPGNIRELENCIERACILCEGTTLEPEDLRLPTATPPAGRRRRS